MANRKSTPASGDRKPGAVKVPNAASRGNPERKHPPRISPEQRERIVAEAAYFIAERRGFAAGQELDDWLEAEAQVNRTLGGSGSR